MLEVAATSEKSATLSIMLTLGASRATKAGPTVEEEEKETTKKVSANHATTLKQNQQTPHRYTFSQQDAIHFIHTTQSGSLSRLSKKRITSGTLHGSADAIRVIASTTGCPDRWVDGWIVDDCWSVP